MKKWLALLLAALVLAGCGSPDPPEDAGGDRVQSPAGTAAVSQGLSVRNARSFDLQYLAGGAKLLCDAAGRELLLVPQGASVPEGYEKALRIPTPVTGVMLTSPAQASFLEALEAESVWSSIAALTEDASQWTEPGILEGFAEGRIAYIDPEAWDPEAIAAAAPSLVFLDASRDTDGALAAVLDGLGIPYAAVAEVWESGAEAHLEWMKFFAAFYGLDREASALYDTRLGQLEALYALGSALPEDQRPTAAVCVVRGGAVYTLAGGSPAVRQLERAGAVYVLRDTEGAGEVRMSMEDFSEKCKEADILLYAARPEDMEGTLTDIDPLFAEFKAVQEGRVFVLDSGFYRKSAQAAALFEDLLALCRPEEAEGHRFTILQPLY